MAKTKISEFSTTAGNNTDINSINIAEGCAPSGINDAIRELMRQLKEFQTGGAGDSVNSGGDFSVATNKFTVASATGNTSVAGTLGATGDFAVNTDKFTVAASSGNTAVAGTFAVTGATTLTGALVANGNSTLGDADTDTVTLNASFVNGTTLKTAKTATNTLALAAYDVDGTAYTNLVTLTAGNTPSLALTSTAVGTINNMSIGATTASTGAFTTLSASGNVTLSGGTANGVLYLNDSKVATSGTALTFDGTNLGIGLSTLDAKLNVNGYSGNGTLRIGGGTTGESVLYFADSGSGVGSYAGFLQYLHSSDNLVFGAAAAEQMRLTSTGLGIGTSSPNKGSWSKALTLEGASNEAYELVTNGTYMGWFAAGGSSVTIGTKQANPFIFFTSDTERMRLDSSGNLGIGTSSPTAFGSGYTTLTISGSNAGIFQSKNTSGDTRLYANTDGDAYLGSWANTSLKIYTNSTVKATIDTSGNLGLGVTSFGTSAAKVLGLANATAPSSSPAGMGQLYVEGGALKYRGSSGTVTTIAAA